jgi:hypothetical protein
LAKVDDQLIILLGGGTKKRQDVDIAEAKRLYLEYKDRKAKLKVEAEKLKAAQVRKKRR